MAWAEVAVNRVILAMTSDDVFIVVISHPDPQTTGDFRETSPTGDFHFRCVNAGSAERGFPGRFTGVHPCGRPGTIISPSPN
jgi:hypothetical protein